MIPRLCWLVILGSSLSMLAFSASATPEGDTELNKLCKNIIVEYDFDLQFTNTEKLLVCGSPGIKAWENIPLRQAQFHLMNFLSARGYHNSQFKIIDEQLFVKPGLPTLIHDIYLQAPESELGVENFWLPRGKPLTPEQLTTIEQWTTAKLARQGYPCAEVHTQGDPDTGDVKIFIEKGPLWTLREVKSDPIPGVRGGMLRRYEAFKLGHRYDSMLLDISAERLKASQVIVNTQYRPECRGVPGLIEQRTLAGKPKLLSFGFGFDSENLFVVKAGWRNSRWSDTASMLDLSSTLSYHSQKILQTLDWYYLPIPSNHYLKNYVRLERNFEPRYESRSVKAVFAPAFAGDLLGIRGDIYLGPSLQFENTVRGEGLRNARLLTLDLGMSGQSHPFEYYSYLAKPQTGYEFNLFASISDKGVGSNVAATMYSGDFTRLWNVLSLEPEIWIFGIRGSFAATRPGQKTAYEDLPPSFKYTLGGSENMRGFGRKALPTEGSGALTKAYIGTELRLNNSLPYQLQPLIFTDWGKLGQSPMALDPTLFWSPGLGLRWESPIGVLRFLMGYGFVAGADKDKYENVATAQFYGSIGEQF